jgi:hypothetical protein
MSEDCWLMVIGFGSEAMLSSQLMTIQIDPPSLLGLCCSILPGYAPLRQTFLVHRREVNRHVRK